MRRLTNMLLFLIICGVMLIFQPLSAQANPLDPYIEGAKKEGSVTVGATLRNKIHGKPAAELFFAAFQKKYPFLKVNFKRIGGPRERERVATEMVAGVFSYDVVTDIDTNLRMVIDAKLPRVVDWKKLGVPKFLVHPDNYGMSLRAPVFGIAYNRDLVPDEVAKTFTWETCTDPKWQGKTALHILVRHLEQLYEEDAWGRDKTLAYAKRWAANKPAIEHSQSTVTSKLTAGAYHFVCGLPRVQIKDLQVYGDAKSLGIVFPEPVPVGNGDFIYVPDKAKHPNAGILFMVWTGTQEAQNLLDAVAFSGHPAFEGNEINSLLKGKKVSYGTWENAVRSERIAVEIIAAMGMPVVRENTKKKK
ncbi:MAG: extracellular solute-binding protein [Desulfobacterales bacterium]|nr:extracellular solute-binding protein [Desulfobacterales bacterium]